MFETTLTYNAAGELINKETVQVTAQLLPDITAVVAELDAQRVRLAAAEDALDHLIVASLDDLGGL